MQEALDLLKSNGATALDRARTRSNEFGQQSEQISDISRQARHQEETLEAQARENKQIAAEANEKASKAYDLAKSTLGKQQEIK